MRRPSRRLWYCYWVRTSDTKHIVDNRRNSNCPVLLLGLGIFFVTTVRQLASVIAYFVVGDDPLLLLIVFFGISITGIVSVFYAFVWA